MILAGMDAVNKMFTRQFSLTLMIPHDISQFCCLSPQKAYISYEHANQRITNILSIFHELARRKQYVDKTTSYLSYHPL